MNKNCKEKSNLSPKNYLFESHSRHFLLIKVKYIIKILYLCLLQDIVSVMSQGTYQDRLIISTKASQMKRCRRCK